VLEVRARPAGESAAGTSGSRLAAVSGAPVNGAREIVSGGGIGVGRAPKAQYLCGFSARPGTSVDGGDCCP
jgi:hypothetical protein